MGVLKKKKKGEWGKKWTVETKQKILFPIDITFLSDINIDIKEKFIKL